MSYHIKDAGFSNLIENFYTTMNLNEGRVFPEGRPVERINNNFRIGDQFIRGAIHHSNFHFPSSLIQSDGYQYNNNNVFDHTTGRFVKKGHAPMARFPPRVNYISYNSLDFRVRANKNSLGRAVYALRVVNYDTGQTLHTFEDMPACIILTIQAHGGAGGDATNGSGAPFGSDGLGGGGGGGGACVCLLINIHASISMLSEEFLNVFQIRYHNNHPNRYRLTFEKVSTIINVNAGGFGTWSQRGFGGRTEITGLTPSSTNDAWWIKVVGFSDYLGINDFDTRGLDGGNAGEPSETLNRGNRIFVAYGSNMQSGSPAGSLWTSYNNDISQGGSSANRGPNNRGAGGSTIYGRGTRGDTLSGPFHGTGSGGRGGQGGRGGVTNNNAADNGHRGAGTSRINLHF